MKLEYKNVTGIAVSDRKKLYRVHERLRFAKEDKVVLKDISFFIESGYIMGLLGENGAGKTTLMKYLLEPEFILSGKILWNGQDIRENHVWILEQMGFVSDETAFVKGYSAVENANLLSGFYSNWDMERFYKIMEEIKVPTQKTLKEMSRGEYIKFQFAFAYAHFSKLYLLDEVTASMDLVFRREFYQLLRKIMAEEEVIVLMSTHLQTEVDQNMDYIGVLEKGKLISFGENIV